MCYVLILSLFKNAFSAISNGQARRNTEIHMISQSRSRIRIRIIRDAPLKKIFFLKYETFDNAFQNVRQVSITSTT